MSGAHSESRPWGVTETTFEYLGARAGFDRDARYGETRPARLRPAGERELR